MIINHVLSVYCSKEYCVTIKQQQSHCCGMHLTMTIIENQISLKNVYDMQNRCFPLQKNDHLIAIDHPPCVIFINDFAMDNLHHFMSLQHFYDWMNSYMANYMIA